MDQPAPYFLVEVEYRPEEGESSFDEIRLKKLPVKLDYMVYFLRKYLRVHFNNEQTKIDYASLSHFILQDFNKEMKSLESRLKMSAIKKKI